MKYAFVFVVFGCVCGFYAATFDSLPLRFIFGSSAVAFTGVGLAYAWTGAKTFLKQSNGRLHPMSYVVYWPYHLLNALSLQVFRLAQKENVYDEINRNLYLGCQLGQRDHKIIGDLRLCSVLDLACEFSELAALRQLSYLCIPILDTQAPTLEQLKTGAEWIQQQSKMGPVYVHCALGHGRSATFVAAYLMMSGEARTAQEAVAQIQSSRPKIGLSAAQMARLRQLEAVG